MLSHLQLAVQHGVLALLCLMPLTVIAAILLVIKDGCLWLCHREPWQAKLKAIATELGLGLLSIVAFLAFAAVAIAVGGATLAVLGGLWLLFFGPIT